jgi:hypothetical protein
VPEVDERIVQNSDERMDEDCIEEGFCRIGNRSEDYTPDKGGEYLSVRMAEVING